MDLEELKGIGEVKMMSKSLIIHVENNSKKYIGYGEAGIKEAILAAFMYMYNLTYRYDSEIDEYAKKILDERDSDAAMKLMKSRHYYEYEGISFEEAEIYG